MNKRSHGFYTTIEPKDRLEKIDDSFSEKERSFIKTVWSKRYKEIRETYADRFLEQCLNLQYYFRNPSSLSFFSKQRIKKVLDALMLEQAVSGDDIQKELLYLEYYNTALCYIDTCSDPGYHSLMGVIPAGNDSRLPLIVQDIWEMSEGAAKRMGIKKELSPWINAFEDALFDKFDGSKDLFWEYDLDH